MLGEIVGDVSVELAVDVAVGASGRCHGYASVAGFVCSLVVGCVSFCAMVALSSSCRYELPVVGSLYATYALLETLRISAVLLSGAETMIWKPSRGSTVSARLV